MILHLILTEYVLFQYHFHFLVFLSEMLLSLVGVFGFELPPSEG